MTQALKEFQSRVSFSSRFPSRGRRGINTTTGNSFFARSIRWSIVFDNCNCSTSSQLATHKINNDGVLNCGCVKAIPGINALVAHTKYYVLEVLRSSTSF